MKIIIPLPSQQIIFSNKLAEIKKLYLSEALRNTIGELPDLKELDLELSRYVPADALKKLAQIGLRGEFIFPTPCLLKQNPRLLGYYRLLLGHSQKAFYQTSVCGKFKPMEMRGTLNQVQESSLIDLCEALIENARHLVEGIGFTQITQNLIDDLTVLTVGPQLRGSANNTKGDKGITDVFDSIHYIVRKHVVKSTSKKIELINAAKKHVIIEFAPDPDIVIRAQMSKKGSYRNIIAIEVKAGTDFSNIHNRIGEAEKSHQKARNQGYVQCWTVINVDNFDELVAKTESPSTNRFYKISDLLSKKGDDYEDFKDHIVSLTGIKG